MNKFKAINLPSRYNNVHCYGDTICTIVVDALDNFQVGFLTAAQLPDEGTLLDPESYEDALCGTKTNFVVQAGLQVDLECPDEVQETMWQYVVVQSLDPTAERLCLAEVGVYEPGQYAITLILLHLRRESKKGDTIPVSYTHLTLPTNREV